MSEDWDTEADSGVGGFNNGWGGSSGGFGKSSGGFGQQDDGGWKESGATENGGWNDGGSSFGKQQRDEGGFGGGGWRGGRGGHGGRGGGRGGFGGRRSDDGEGGWGGRSGGFGSKTSDDGENGGGWGRRGGGGGFGRRRDDGDDESGGFGGRSGGFGRRRDDGEEGGSGFGGRGRGRGGGFGRRRDDGDGDNESGGFGGFGRKRSDDDGEDGGGGFGGRGRGRGRGGGFGGGRRDDSGGFGDNIDLSEDSAAPKREIYIPPAPPEDEESIFATITTGINFDKYDEISVEVTGRDPPRNITTFEECGFFETTQKNIERCKYTRPTPVQKYAIPIVMQGRDLMACAQTGSGKTAAFLLPVITAMIRDNVQGASENETQQLPQVLIISPTRELTMQIYNEARKFTNETIYRPVVVYGGTSVGHQLRQVERGCNILVATPGRLLDFLNRKKVVLDELKVLILDEADRMLDMGFEPEIRKVVGQFNMPEKTDRQTLMFSATFPEEIQRLAGEFLNDYLFLTVGQVGGATTDIEQRVVEVGEYDKREKLQEILGTSGSDRVLVFVETKRNADFLASFLSQEEFPTTSIHGDRFQREREEALRDFKSGRSRVLVATSVAARGLDIPKVKHVINYDMPSTIEEYVHRIGRTGRIGNKGIATAFFQKDRDGALARGLVKVLSDAHQDVPDFLEQAAEEAVGSNYGPQGGQFASKDMRFHGRGGGGGGKGDSSGYGNDTGGFGSGFGESSGGGFGVANNDEEWD